MRLLKWIVGLLGLILLGLALLRDSRNGSSHDTVQHALPNSPETPAPEPVGGQDVPEAGQSVPSRNSKEDSPADPTNGMERELLRRRLASPDQLMPERGYVRQRASPPSEYLRRDASPPSEGKAPGRPGRAAGTPGVKKEQ
jgi:hypothetical protein